MVRTQVYLSPRNVERLHRIAAQTGKSHSALIREAIDRLEAPESRRAAVLAQTFGAWSGGPEAETLRREWDARLDAWEAPDA